MKPGTLQEDGLLLLQKRSVGGEDDPKSGIMCKTEKDFQQGVAQWLTHKVKIKIICPRAKLGKQCGEFRLRHAVLCPFRTRTEAAVQVANVGDLQIDFTKAFHSTPPDG